jgi:hypothetical protein
MFAVCCSDNIVVDNRILFYSVHKYCIFEFHQKSGAFNNFPNYPQSGKRGLILGHCYREERRREKKILHKEAKPLH